MNKFQKLITWLCVVVLTIILGCSTFQDAVTPCYIPPEVIESVDANLPLISWMPYSSVFDARYVKTRMYFQYLLYNNLMTASIQASEQLQQTLFSPSGLIGLLCPALTGGVIGTMLLSKPEDKKKIKELEKKVNGNSH